MGKLVLILALTYLLIISILVGKVSNLITLQSLVSYSSIRDPLEEGMKTVPKIGDAFRHVLIFLQISDLHLSKFHDATRIRDFKEFCSSTVDAIQPSVVIASGDLTDGKYADGIRTGEFEDDWIIYRNALKESGVREKTTWLDIRGNHDNFNVPTLSGSMYAKYSVQGQQNGSYIYTIVPKMEKFNLHPSERYSFIGVDAGLSPGPIAPWNFYGKVDLLEYRKLEKFEEASRNSNGTIWFGHYPTSLIVSPSNKMSLRELMKNAIYLCGHLHTVYGLVDPMYAIQKSGLLELELGDFKSNRRYRIAAFDHETFAFTDALHGKWPQILVTNPKKIMFNNNQKDLNASRISTHIRILAFSISKITSVSVKIDNENWVPCINVKGPLFVSAWDPSKYFHGIHQMEIIALDQDGRKYTETHKFAFDESRENFSFLAKVALMIDGLLLPTIYFCAAILVVFPIILTRILHYLVKSRRMSFETATNGLGKFGKNCLRKLWITSTVNKLFYPLVIPPIYLTIGPIYAGEMVQGNFGLAFAWGTLINDRFLPPAISYIVDGCLQLLWFQLPFMLALADCVDRRFKMICWREDKRTQFWNNFPLLVWFLLQISISQLVNVITGFPILLLGHLQHFCFVYGVCLWFLSAKLNKSHFAEAESVWVNPNRRMASRNYLMPIEGKRNDVGTDHES